MSEFVNSYKGLNVTNNRIGMLMADFDGLNKLEKIVNDVLIKLSLQENVNNRVAQVKSGSMSMREFDGWFSEVVRVELGRTLGIIRNKAIKKARDAGAGSAQTAVLRRMYRDEYGANINICGNRRRLSSKERVVPEPKGGESGIRRLRHVSERTKMLRKYFGPDRSFILRFLDSGTDVRTAKTYGPTGRRSQATYGNRESIDPKGFFHQMQSDMELAAKELGETLVHHVEKWNEQQFTESK